MDGPTLPPDLLRYRVVDYQLLMQTGMICMLWPDKTLLSMALIPTYSSARLIRRAVSTRMRYHQWEQLASRNLSLIRPVGLALIPGTPLMLSRVRPSSWLRTIANMGITERV